MMDFQIVYSKSNKVFVMHRRLAIAHLCIVLGAVWPPGSPASGVDPCQAAHLRTCVDNIIVSNDIGLLYCCSLGYEKPKG